MKKLFLVTIIFISKIILAQPDYLIDSLVVKTSNDTVYVWDYNAWEQCDFKLAYTAEIIDSIIIITQIDTASYMTTCYCYHNFVVPIIGLCEGKYRIDIYRNCLYHEYKFIKSVRFDYTFSGIDNREEPPNQFLLHNAYPNPFNPATIISYTLPGTGFVSLKIYNSLGQKIATLVSEQQNCGTHEVEFRAEGLAGGLYYYSLEFDNNIKTKKIILVK